jgi:hypothetical protein
MESLTKDYQLLDPNTFALFMFLSLSQQAEGWAWALKGKVNMRTKQLLNTYLNSAKSLFTHIQGQADINDLLDDSAIWTDLMNMLRELPLHKQQALYVAFKELLAGNIQVEDDEPQTLTLTVN